MVKWIIILLFICQGVLGQTVWRASDAGKRDAATNTLQTIDYAHHEVHSGSHYTVTDNRILGDGDSISFLITTPNTTKWAHLITYFSGTLDTDVEVYETTTHTAGTGLTEVNNNRNSDNTATTTIAISNSDGADGDLIYVLGFGQDSGNGVNKVTSGGATRGDAEFILKQDTKYLVTIYSNSALNKVSTSFEWYEHTDIE